MTNSFTLLYLLDTRAALTSHARHRLHSILPLFVEGRGNHRCLGAVVLGAAQNHDGTMGKNNLINSGTWCATGLPKLLRDAHSTKPLGGHHPLAAAIDMVRVDVVRFVAS